MDAAIISLVGVAIGAIAGLLGAIINNRYQLRKDHEQWQRQEQSEHEKWLKTELYEIYTNCVHYLALLNSGMISPENKSQAEKWIRILLFYVLQNREDLDTTVLIHASREFSDNLRLNSIDRDTIALLNDAILEMATKDQRLGIHGVQVKS